MANFFRFWFAVRRTSCQEHIVGDETLGMTPELKDKSYPLFGKIPLPPVLIHQLDMVLTLGILNPLQKIVFEDFQRVVQANKPRSWMTIYLITFIALHNCGILTTAARLNARRHGLRVSHDPAANMHQIVPRSGSADVFCVPASLLDAAIHRRASPQRECLLVTLSLRHQVLQPLQD